MNQPMRKTFIGEAKKTSRTAKVRMSRIELSRPTWSMKRTVKRMFEMRGVATNSESSLTLSLAMPIAGMSEGKLFSKRTLRRAGIWPRLELDRDPRRPRLYGLGGGYAGRAGHAALGVAHMTTSAPWHPRDGVGVVGFNDRLRLLGG